jgi:glycolate oxidase
MQEAARTISQEAMQKLKELFGQDLVYTPEDLTLHGYDAANLLYRPEAVAYPETSQKLQALMKLANEMNFPVVPRGAGAGFSGGSLAVRGGLVINLARMNKILAIDEENLTADVEPGVLTGDLHAAVEERGLFYPPDPASSAFCTIGGNIAENAGGPRAFKYGVTEHYILGLEAVTPTGELINAGGRTIKNVAGYNLLKLLIGSEGTLGIVTKAILKLIPKPPFEKTIQLFFPDVNAAAKTVAAIIAAKVIPGTLEFMDEGSLTAVRKAMNFQFNQDHKSLLLVKVDGHPAACEDEAARVAEIARENGCTEVNMADSAEDEAEIWKIRKNLSPAVGKMANTKLNEDVVVPRSKIPQLIRKANEIGAKHGVMIVNFGHSGDGNIHVNFMYDRFDSEQREGVVQGVNELMAEVIRMDGSISGEHGIGIMKNSFMGLQYDEPTLEVMRALKRTLDPNNILNPGKIFPEEL